MWKSPTEAELLEQNGEKMNWAEFDSAWFLIVWKQLRN